MPPALRAGRGNRARAVDAEHDARDGGARDRRARGARVAQRVPRHRAAAHAVDVSVRHPVPPISPAPACLSPDLP